MNPPSPSSPPGTHTKFLFQDLPNIYALALDREGLKANPAPFRQSSPSVFLLFIQPGNSASHKIACQTQPKTRQVRLNLKSVGQFVSLRLSPQDSKSCGDFPRCGVRLKLQTPCARNPGSKHSLVVENS